MSATGILTKKGPSLSEKIVQASMYIIISGIIIFYGRDWVATMMEAYAEDLPISIDIAVTLVSVALGILIPTILIFFFKRSVRKEVTRNVV